MLFVEKSMVLRFVKHRFSHHKQYSYTHKCIVFPSKLIITFRKTNDKMRFNTFFRFLISGMQENPDKFLLRSLVIIEW